MKATFLPVLALLTLGPWEITAEPVTTGSLLREMTDLRRLTRLPEPWFRTVQFSSTDRRSQLPGGPDWHANSDGFGREPIPNFEAVLREPGDDGVGDYLICDVSGPGAVVRTWTARIEGRIRMFLDGATDPVFDGPADDFFLHPYRPYLADADLEEAPFIDTFQQRQACYFPMPFAERCRIEWTGRVEALHFYEVQLRLYEPGTEVRTFRPTDLKTHRQDLIEVAATLREPDAAGRPSPDASTHPVAVVLSPRASQEALVIEGARVVERLTLRVQAADLDRALRQTVLHLRFDEFPWGQIQCPVGDFFGAAPGVNPYQSLPFTVQPDGTMVCRFAMPFARSMRMTFENRGDQQVSVSGSVVSVEEAWDPNRSMHLRARWRVDHDLLNTAPYDLPFLVARGEGLYVGTTSMLLNPCAVPTPYGNWWGEGDEKIFVDAETQPGIFGTGSEDYYNYAWSSPDIFEFPYCGQPRNDGPGNRGFVTNLRWHILDPIPFRQGLAFYMEFFSHERTPGYSYARTAYHYARPGLMDDHLPITDEDLRPLKPVAWLPEARAGAQGATFFQTEALLPASAPVSMLAGRLFAGGTVAVWEPRRPGDELVLSLTVPTDGRYVVGFTARLSPDSGTFRARIDDRPLEFGGPVNLHRPHRTLLRNFLARPMDLTAGTHQLRVRSEGPGEAGGGLAIGLDFVWLQIR